jgi:magnesium transporter
MARSRYFKRHHPPGTAPGTLTAPEGAEAPRISLIAYGPDEVRELEISAPDEAKPHLEKWPVTWINVDGLGDVSVPEGFGRIFGLHPLALEDVLNLRHRPKTEDFDDHIFMVLRMARMGEGGKPQTEQVSLFAGKGFVLTFQERRGDCLDPLRERIRKGKGRRLRGAGADYLAYAVLDSVIDGYFPVLEHYGDEISEIEDEVIGRPDKSVIATTHAVRQELQFLRHHLWPMREAVNRFSHAEHFVVEATRPYLRDCHDHVIELMDVLETYRERASGLIDIYLSSLSNRMNEVMKVLTIIATLFIPLSFVTGLYGMNFDHMPELHWRYGYAAALTVMALMAAGLLWYFRRKGWLGGGEE